ncbi:4Fe-4S dicluster domain-containing protein [Ruminococcaceae bacterium OttesenSCG-928-N02]|nr:4Fe-4S dicluster domain-containing protein [Ruminococcaceae bacterium OttesenSCG-928-N02]
MKNRAEGVSQIKKYRIPLLLWLSFEAVAVVLWLALGNLFYLLNFTYIGTAIAVGLALYVSGFKYARMVVQLSVGLYMLIYLGVISRENMQIEGLWYYLSLGVFEAAVIHYLVAKIGGPLLFGRGWCGYACWTAMVLDLLPYKTPQKPRHKKLGWFRVVSFALSIAYFLVLSRLYPSGLENLMFISFILGNLIYYAMGIALAFACKDNRAFCKYVCPITVFLKPASYFARLRITVDADACISCGKCKKACPMDVDMLDNRRNRENGTECILCFECQKACPKQAIK